MQLRQSHSHKEGILQVSKWLKTQVLLSEEECMHLLEALGDFFIFNVSEPVSLKEAVIPRPLFLERYSMYVQALKQGKIPDTSSLRATFSSIFTLSSDLVYAMPIKEEKFLIKPTLPVVQLQLHHFYFSSLDRSFHPLVFGPESVTWGLQFSYPQLYQDPHMRTIAKISKSDVFPNTELYLRLVSWIRKETQPTPFLYQDTKLYAPLRIGKKSLEWVKNHPQLHLKGLTICA